MQISKSFCKILKKGSLPLIFDRLPINILCSGHSVSTGSGQSPIISKIMALADKAEEKGAMKMHAEAKKELPVDEVSKVEKEIYENWEKGMRFQGRMN